METRNKDWQDMILPICAKMKLHAYLGSTYQFNPKGAEAMANLLADMAMKLDLSNDHRADLCREIASLTDKLNKVTTEGNDV